MLSKLHFRNVTYVNTIDTTEDTVQLCEGCNLLYFAGRKLLSRNEKHIKSAFHNT